jgi:hypothetical protein
LAAAQEYAPRDLGTLGGAFSWANAVNNRGQGAVIWTKQ